MSSEATLSVEIVNKRGLHARASAKFVKLAGTFDAEVRVTKDGQTVDARSIMGLMMLAAGPGCPIGISAEGVDAEAAVKALMEAGRFHAVVDRTYPLDAIAEAYRYVETGQKAGIVAIEVVGG